MSAIHQKNKNGKKAEDKAVNTLKDKLDDADLPYLNFQRTKEQKGTDSKVPGRRAVESLSGNEDFVLFDKIVDRCYSIPVIFEEEPYYTVKNKGKGTFSAHDLRLFLPFDSNGTSSYWNCHYEVKNQDVDGSVDEKLYQGFPNKIINNTYFYNDVKPVNFWAKEVVLIMEGESLGDEVVERVLYSTKQTLRVVKEKIKDKIPRIIISNSLEDHFSELINRYVKHLKQQNSLEAVRNMDINEDYIAVNAYESDYYPVDRDFYTLIP